MFRKGKNILFYNAIPMPHSIMLHKALAENGYEVKFWYYKDLTKLYPWNSLNADKEYFVYGKNGNNLFVLIKQVAKSDLVIITGWHTKIHVLLAVLCFLKKIKYAYWLDVPMKPKPGIATSLKNLLLRMADFLLVTGNEGIERISTWGNLNKNKFRDFPYLSAEVNDQEIIEINNKRSSRLNENEKIKVLISNRFEKRKGYKCVYNALITLGFPELDKFSFTIIGSGSEFEYYKNLFKESGIQINFKFWVEYEEYLNFIKETDILIHASLHEPYGIPPADAMAHGKLVIVSDEVMSTRDRIINGKNGYIFKADDSLGLSDILKALSKDPKLVYNLGGKAFKDAKKYQLPYNLAVINDIFSK